MLLLATHLYIIITELYYGQDSVASLDPQSILLPLLHILELRLFRSPPNLPILCLPLPVFLLND
jgi:hypothetical protein